MDEAERSTLHDAMPYVDRDYAVPEMKARVDRMIEEELARGGSREQTALPKDIELFSKNPALAAELERVSRKEPLDALDFSRFELPAPPIEKDDDVKEWEKAVANAKAQMEAQQSRMLNLELLGKYGSNAWLIHNYQIGHVVKQLQQDLEDHKKKIEELNKVRKVDQISQGFALQNLEQQWSTLIGQIVSLEAAILAIEVEIEDMETQRDLIVQQTPA